MELMGLTEVAEMFGMTRDGADKLVKREPDFPPPMTVQRGTRIWDREAVETWARDRKDQGSGETAACARCSCGIAITDSEFSAWEVFEGNVWTCEGCLRDTEAAVFGDDAMEMAAKRCIRCHRRQGRSRRACRPRRGL
jgi:predicted DNA-binding transcriptional regulator AlpA